MEVNEGQRLPPHWYFITITECVLCGHGSEDRERRFTPRPEDGNDRYSHVQTACWAHFA